MNIKLPLTHGVCLKATPEVEAFLDELDDIRRFLSLHMIAETRKSLAPSQDYEVKVRLGKSYYVTYTCTGVIAPHPEVIILSYDEDHKHTNPDRRKTVAGVVSATLVMLELLYYGGNLPHVVQNFIDTLRTGAFI